MDYGHEEVMVKFGGDPRRFNTQSKEFLFDDDGRVSGIRTTLVEWTKINGRWTMAEVPESEKVYPCQLVLLAMGFLGMYRSRNSVMTIFFNERIVFLYHQYFKHQNSSQYL